MKEIRIKRTEEKIIGAVRVNKILFDKISNLAKENEVSNQVIVREILENFIDEVIIK